jgi:AsmA protein
LAPVRRWRVLGLAALLGVAIAAAQPWRIAEEAVQAHVLAGLTEQLGIEVHSTGGGAVALLPTPRIIAGDVRARLPGADIEVTIPRLRAEVKLLALLAGRLSFDRLTLVTPQITLRDTGAASEPLALLTDVSLSGTRATPQIIIENGSLFVRSGPGILTSARNITVEIGERAAGAAFEVTGELLWRGERLTFAVATDSAARAVIPTVRLRSAPVNLDFTASRRESGSPPGAALTGHLELVTPSLSRLGAWLASGSPILLPLGATALRGPITITQRSVEMKAAQVTLGADALEGALDWRRRDGRWRLTGTLAGRSLDVGRPQAGIDTDRMTQLDLSSTVPVDVDDLFAHDIDVRLSLQRVRFRGLTLTDVAGQIMSTAERLDVSLANATLHRGSLKGRATLARGATEQGGIELRLALNGDRIDAGAFSAELFDARRLTGSAFLQQTLETRGASPAELLRRAQGRFSLVVRAGDLAGVNLPDVLRRYERQPLSLARDWRGGRTAFEQLALNGAIQDGLLVLGDSVVSGAGYALRLEGVLGLADRAVRIRGQLQGQGSGPNAGQPAGPATGPGTGPATGPAAGPTTGPVAGQAAASAPALPFVLEGPLAEPTLSFSLPSLLERSGAVELFQRAR